MAKARTPHLFPERDTLSAAVVEGFVQTSLAAELEDHADVRLATTSRRKISSSTPESDNVRVPNAHQNRQLQQQLAHFCLDLRTVRRALLDSHRRTIVRCTVDHAKRSLVQLPESRDLRSRNVCRRDHCDQVSEFLFRLCQLPTRLQIADTHDIMALEGLRRSWRPADL